MRGFRMEKLKNKKIIFHIHTKHSYDSNLNPKKIVDYLLKNGVDCAIITDHESIKGAVEAKMYAKEKYGEKIQIIIGEEVKTDIGDIIGFPLKKKIISRKISSVLKEIKNQNGYTVLPHPYKNHDIKKIEDKHILNKMDFIETKNSRTKKEDNKKATKLAKKNKLKCISGSDAHFEGELMNAIIKYDDEMNLKLISYKKSKLGYKRKSQIIKNLRSKNLINLLKYTALYVLKK